MQGRYALPRRPGISSLANHGQWVVQETSFACLNKHPFSNKQHRLTTFEKDTAC